MWTEYCQKHQNNNYCSRINRYVTSSFCLAVCKGNADKWKQPPVEEMREKLRQPVTDNNETVSVILPYCDDDVQFVDKTVESIKKTAIGKLEILTEHDKNKEGHRVLTNRLVKRANGKYLFRLDAHCSMSPEWDARLKASCRPKTIVVPILDSLNEKTWQGEGKDMGFVFLDRRLRNQFPVYWKSINDRHLEEETMGLLGCALFMRVDDYWQWGGSDETLGKWGASGLEWSLKGWLTGGRVIIRTDTVCYHLFRPRTQSLGLSNEEIDRSFRKIGRMFYYNKAKGQVRPMTWLLEKFDKYIARAGLQGVTPARFAG